MNIQQLAHQQIDQILDYIQDGIDHAKELMELEEHHDEGYQLYQKYTAARAIINGYAINILDYESGTTNSEPPQEE